MVTGIPIELAIYLMHSNPAYKTGYKDGFEDAKKIIYSDIKKIMKKIEKLEAYKSGSTTVSTF